MKLGLAPTTPIIFILPLIGDQVFRFLLILRNLDLEGHSAATGMCRGVKTLKTGFPLLVGNTQFSRTYSSTQSYIVRHQRSQRVHTYGIAFITVELITLVNDYLVAYFIYGAIPLYLLHPDNQFLS